jgi:hypothetical protein
MAMPPRLAQVAPECAEFATAVEDVLRSRRADPARSRATADGWYGVPRAWTRDELCDVAYSSYRALLRGMVRRPPRRDVVLDIADYLECTMGERNHLLVAAGYAIVDPGPRGAELQRALAGLHAVIELLPLPAYVVSQDWTVQLINAHLVVLFGLDGGAMRRLPAPARNMLRLLFDPALPIRNRLDQDRGSWSRLARLSVFRFKQDNLMWQYEPWYTTLVSSLHELPGFPACWADVQVGRLPAADEDLTAASITVSRPDGQVLRMRPMNAAFHGLGYPGIVTLLPADERSSRELLALGLPSPANNWGAPPHPPG